MKPVEWFAREVTKHVRPVVKDFLISVFEHPENYLEPDQKDATNQLIKFQMALKKIPNWTNTQIKKQIDEIVVRCPGFKKLLVALFISYIKMISDGIRINSKSKRLDVKLPSDEVFVHTCFIDCAHNLYEDPYVMKKSEVERDSELDKRLQECITNSIDKLIPTMDIINNYIPLTNDEVCLGGSREDEDEDMPLQSTSEQQPPVTSTEEPPGGDNTSEEKENDEMVEERAEDLKENEPKTIKTDLFPDAPDKISPKQ